MMMTHAVMSNIAKRVIVFKLSLSNNNKITNISDKTIFVLIVSKLLGKLSFVESTLVVQFDVQLDRH